MCVYNDRINLIDLNDYPVSWWNKILNLAHEIIENPDNYKEAL